LRCASAPQAAAILLFSARAESLPTGRSSDRRALRHRRLARRSSRLSSAAGRATISATASARPEGYRGSADRGAAITIGPILSGEPGSKSKPLFRGKRSAALDRPGPRPRRH